MWQVLCVNMKRANGPEHPNGLYVQWAAKCLVKKRRKKKLCCYPSHHLIIPPRICRQSWRKPWRWCLLVQWWWRSSRDSCPRRYWSVLRSGKNNTYTANSNHNHKCWHCLFVCTVHVVTQHSRMNKMLVVNVAANHWFIHICLCHTCHIYSCTVRVTACAQNMFVTWHEKVWMSCHVCIVEM